MIWYYIDSLDNNSIFADIKQKSATYDFRNDEIQFSETIHQYETISYAHLTQSVKVISSHKKQLKHYWTKLLYLSIYLHKTIYESLSIYKNVKV